MGENQMNKAVRTRAGIAVAGTALLVGGLTACGGDKADGGTAKADGGKGGETKAHSSVEAVKASYLKTVAAKFAKAELSIAGADGKTRGQSGTKGWYPSSHDVILKSEKPDTRSIMIGDMTYSGLAQPRDGKAWMSMNLAKDGKPGVRLNDDPAEYLAMLLGQEKLTHVGAEKTADGVDAEHYKGSFTTADLLKADESTKVMEEANRQYLHEAVKHITTFEVDLWIGKDGYPVRADTVSTDAEGTTKTTAKFSDFAAATPVQAPPAEQVVSFDDMNKETDRKLKEADQKLRDAGLGGLDAAS
ncbi:hypothetical protein Snoj_76410 [Streptomyces nojiriensis]|uniref:Lipoprotein n=2 Tax=Streptomyces nojiriensis TaxID=66374 RepID=A0ABQ3T035_9ACTN|nr:hypothetical protein [Streptomyces nojiriensis]GGR79932.1 hypothetical protein GCM10010205_05900 [Streptomyces nojiriensis]GHI73723.1 hypothetical protein Snoj_76410 [Streptomyces nojiriensis]